MSTRLNDFATGHKVVIQQRLHEGDLSGDLAHEGRLRVAVPTGRVRTGKTMFNLDWLDGSAYRARRAAGWATIDPWCSVSLRQACVTDAGQAG